jgi:hypothetical protein
MIISMGLTMAIQNSRTLAQKFATKNPHGKTETVCCSLQRKPKYYSKNPMARIVLQLQISGSKFRSTATCIIRIIKFRNSIWT